MRQTPPARAVALGSRSPRSSGSRAGQRRPACHHKVYEHAASCRYRQHGQLVHSAPETSTAAGLLPIAGCRSTYAAVENIDWWCSSSGPHQRLTARQSTAESCGAPQRRLGAATGAGASRMAASCPVAPCWTLGSLARRFLGARAGRTACALAAATPSPASAALMSSLAAALCAPACVHRRHSGGWSLKVRRLSSGGSSGCRESILERASAQRCCICGRGARHYAC